MDYLSLFSCRLDISGNVKVSDFGLAEDVYTRGYFKQSKDGSDNVRLPYKWIPPESFQDGVFSEKSDVVRFCNYPITQLALILKYVFLYTLTVGFWCDMLGDIHGWQDSLPCSRPHVTSEDVGRWTEA